MVTEGEVESRFGAFRDGPVAILVGEANPYGGDPEYALYPEPAGCAGQRLCDVVLGLPRRSYLRAFIRVDLCHKVWSVREAKKRAGELDFTRHSGPGLPLVLLGAKVARAFGRAFEPYTVHPALADHRAVAILPHPSGLSRAWNAPAAVHQARSTVRQVLGGDPLPDGWAACVPGACSCSVFPYKVSR